MDRDSDHTGARFTLTSAGVAAIRALRSMAIIGFVALLAFALRTGSLDLHTIARVAALNRLLFVMVFLGLWVWELWYSKARRSHSMDPRDKR